MDAENAAPLTSQEKVAALLFAMGRRAAARLLARFGSADIRQLTQTAAGLRPLSAAEISRIVEEFNARLREGPDVAGSSEGAEQLLASALSPDEVSELMADVRGMPRKSVWARMTAMPKPVLLAALRKEHPQVATVVLDSLDGEVSAEIIGLLTDEERGDVMRRLACLRPVGDHARRVLEDGVEAEILVRDTKESTEDHDARVKGIVARLDKAQAGGVLEAIASARPKLAEYIRGGMFDFERLASLPSRSMLIVLDKVPTESLIVALSGVDDDFRDKIVGSLTARARRMVEQELKSGQDKTEKEIDDARRAIERIVAGLIESRAIEPPGEAAAAG